MSVVEGLCTGRRVGRWLVKYPRESIAAGAVPARLLPCVAVSSPHSLVVSVLVTSTESPEPCVGGEEHRVPPDGSTVQDSERAPAGTSSKPGFRLNMSLVSWPTVLSRLWWWLWGRWKAIMLTGVSP